MVEIKKGSYVWYYPDPERGQIIIPYKCIVVDVLLDHITKTEYVELRDPVEKYRPHHFFKVPFYDCYYCSEEEEKHGEHVELMTDLLDRLNESLGNYFYDEYYH